MDSRSSRARSMSVMPRPSSRRRDAMVNQPDHPVGAVACMPMTIEIRQARPDEYGEPGVVTANAYREFFSGDDPRTRYLEEIADVAGRAPRTTVLVAVDGDRIVGSATLELDGRTSDERRAARARRGAHPDAGCRSRGAPGAAWRKQLMAACEASRARGRPDPDDAAHDTSDARGACDVRVAGLRTRRKIGCSPTGSCCSATRSSSDAGGVRSRTALLVGTTCAVRPGSRRPRTPPGPARP